MKSVRIFLIFTVFFFLFGSHNKSFSQTVLLGPQAFISDILVHGATGSTSAWFAPDYNTPIDYAATGGCSGGYAGYSGSWNNYWGNFLRTPQVNCTGLDSVIMSFDMSNSYFSNHPNDKVYFNMWIDGAYHDATTNQTIYFDSARNCAHFEVVFVLTPYTNKNVMFYLNTSCGYNDSEIYMVKFDNIEIFNPLATEVKNVQNNAETLTAFPNPANNATTIQFKNPDNKTYTLLIYNAMGQEVQKTDNITDSEAKVDVRNIRGGLYFFQLQSNKQIVARGNFIAQ